ncbi:sulfatase-like hydrolase/transferase [Shewanella sedimentimangrovi]|uniref:Sulfatase-like hydrolase/transferase n=1 Tax=Shewanella sedimentimangrovi TaxID=2814293 RepID=A0ABX7R1U2_9GAMM|nr:sulfatase-like hydrolase/transferase [Shewanella sedimentimangrovi]QSX36830.1 sulfatase-like hydrolase/transferase [Shewanella sedimentimangrovi]
MGQGTAESNSTHSGAQVSLLRTFFRTLALMILLLIILFNYKNLIQFYSAFSIANAMTHIDLNQLLEKGFILDIAFFLIVTLSLHALWAVIITISCRPWFLSIADDIVRTQIWFILLLLHLILALAANSLLYPTSLLGIFRNSPLVSIPFISLLSLILFSNFLYGVMSLIFPYKGLANILGATLMCLLLVTFWIFDVPNGQARVNSDQPNIFIIGIDALRPDHLAYRGADFSLAPKLNTLLSQASVYDKTYTPMGRTYVAWMSILSGLYPTNNGARFNLAPPELVQKPFPLVEALSRRGYQTTYAMDERRFNQIDEEYGFDSVVGPKVGAADAIIANLADLPLVNLLINTPVGQYLFPYLNINRAYGKTYDPQLFNKRVVTSLSTTAPNFLAIHFCQLHWPFTSKDFVELDSNQWQGNYNHYMYKAMLKKVDMQVDNFITQLKSKGMLNNAEVILLSDHGEGFKLPEDKLTASTPGKHKLNVSAWGHGTNLLAQEQSEVLLAHLSYRHGKPVNKAVQISGLFSLIDIVPTLRSIMKLPQTARIDGQPLPKAKHQALDERMVFVESSLPIGSVNASFIDEKKVLSETASLYEVRENGRAVMKPEAYQNNIARKQRAVYYRKWQLVLLPDNDGLILANIQTQKWQYLNSYHGSAPWKLMLTSLCEHFKYDAGVIHSEACSKISKIAY